MRRACAKCPTRHANGDQSGRKRGVLNRPRILRQNSRQPSNAGRAWQTVAADQAAWDGAVHQGWRRRLTPPAVRHGHYLAGQRLRVGCDAGSGHTRQDHGRWGTHGRAVTARTCEASKCRDWHGAPWQPLPRACAGRKGLVSPRDALTPWPLHQKAWSSRRGPIRPCVAPTP